MRLGCWRFSVVLALLPFSLLAEEAGQLRFSIQPIAGSPDAGISAPSGDLLSRSAEMAARAWINDSLWGLDRTGAGLDLVRFDAGGALREVAAVTAATGAACGISKGGDGVLLAWLNETGELSIATLPATDGGAHAPGLRQLGSFTPGFAYRDILLVECRALAGDLLLVIGSAAGQGEAILIDKANGNLAGRLEIPGSVLVGMAVGRSHALLFEDSGTGISNGWLIQLDTRRRIPVQLQEAFPEQLATCVALDSFREGARFAFTDNAGRGWILEARIVSRAARISTLDLAVILAYLAVVLLVGYFCARRVASGREVFLAGGRVPGWASGLSIVLTNISAISFIALPSRAFATDSTMLLFLFTPVVAAPVVIRFIIPTLRKGSYLTAYEVLGTNFGYGFRKLGSWFYCIYELGRTGVLLVVPSIIIAMMTGMPVMTCLLLTAVVTTAYTSFGGYEAVVWTDVIQGLIMFVALLATPVLVFVSIGSPAEAIGTAFDAGRFRMIDTSPSLDQFGWIVLIFSLATAFQSYLWHQPTVQRILSGRDERAMRTTIITAAISSPLMLSLMFFGGGLLYSYYSRFPERMAIAVDGRDEVFASFVMQEMPTGLAGLVIAAIFAASMSSLSSGINSIASVISGDIVSERVRERLTENRWFGRWITLGAGVLGSVIALVVLKANALSLFDVFMEFTYLIAGSLAGVFALALFGNRFQTVHAVVGFIGSIVVVAAAKMSGQVSFMLFATLGIAACLLFALLAALLIPSARKPENPHA